MKLELLTFIYLPIYYDNTNTALIHQSVCVKLVGNDPLDPFYDLDNNKTISLIHDYSMIVDGKELIIIIKYTYD